MTQNCIPNCCRRRGVKQIALRRRACGSRAESNRSRSTTASKGESYESVRESILFTGAVVMGASGLMAAQADKTKMSLKHLVKQTKALEATAEAPTQHKALAAEYRQLARRQLTESNKHAEEAAWYARFPIYSSAKFRAITIDPCQRLADRYRDDAQRSEQVAAHHEALAS